MTPTLKLKSIVLQNFGPFVGEHRLDLPENGLHMVLGENLDTDESSGAGKSSLVESLAYAFDYSTFAATELKSWDWMTKEPLSVSVGFECLCPSKSDKPDGTVEVDLTRSKKSSLFIDQNFSITSAKAVKEELDQLLGVRPEMLKALTYRPQGQPGLFLAMTDQEKKSFLTELLGLQPYEAEADRVVKAIGELEEYAKTKTAVADTLKSQVPPEPVPLPPLNIVVVEQSARLLEAEVSKMETGLQVLRAADERAHTELDKREDAINASWRPHIENLQVALSVLESRPVMTPLVERPSPSAELPVLRKKLELVRQGIEKAKTAHQEKLKGLRSQLTDERGNLYRVQSHATNQKQAALAETVRLTTEVEALRQQLCAMCQRPWSDHNHALYLQKALDDLDLNKAAIVEADMKLEQAKTIEHRVKELDVSLTFETAADPVPPKLAAVLESLTKEIASAEATYKAECAAVESKHAERVRTLRAEKQVEVAEARARLAKAETDYVTALNQAAEMTPEHVRVHDQMTATKELRDQLMADYRVAAERVRSLKENHAERQQTYERDMAAWTVAYERYRKAVAEVDDVSATLDRERDYLGCIRSFLGVIFDETLDRVAYLTNERLSKVPNVQGLALHFVSERETKTTKNLRQEIRPIVERDGHEIPLKRTSGGQYTAVELAVDLSVADVIAERTGVMPGWLVLDEAFNGLPIKSKTACLELLKNASQTRLILVVDHATEFKELFDSNIIVRSRDGLSSFA